MALRMSSEEKATAQVVWAGEIPAACDGPQWSGSPKAGFESVSVVHASPQAGSGARKKAGAEVLRVLARFDPRGFQATVLRSPARAGGMPKESTVPLPELATRRLMDWPEG